MTIITHADQQFTRDELIAASSNVALSTIQSLLPMLPPGWALETYGNGNSVTLVDMRQININHCQPLQRGLIDLAWEITNAINADVRKGLETSAAQGTCVEYEFVTGIHRMEAEAQLHAMLTAQQLQLDVYNIGFSNISEAVFSQLLAGTIDKQTYIDTVSKEHYEHGVIKNNAGEVLAAREEYGRQFRAIARLSV